MSAFTLRRRAVPEVERKKEKAEDERGRKNHRDLSYNPPHRNRQLRQAAKISLSQRRDSPLCPPACARRAIWSRDQSGRIGHHRKAAVKVVGQPDLPSGGAVRRGAKVEGYGGWGRIDPKGPSNPPTASYAAGNQIKCAR